MRPQTRWLSLVSACGAVLLLGSVSPAPAQETHVGSLTGRAAAGKPLYTRYCAGCHGDDGDAQGENAQWIDPKPRDFTVATFKCRSTASGSLPTPQPIVIPAEPAATVESIRRGRESFQRLECWKCHGPAGHGDGPSASTLTDSKDDPIRPYDFQTGTRFMCGSTNEDLYRIFMTGLDGSPMPSFADQLQPAEAWDLVHFLRTLQPLKTRESAIWHEWAATHAGELKPIGPEGGGQ